MAKSIDKVLAYITRENHGRLQVLVFEHVDHPEAGLQVPAGTVAENEDLQSAVLREIREEAGLSPKLNGTRLGSFDYFRADRNENHRRHVFHFPMTDTLPDEWIHEVGGTGEDRDLKFRFHWLPLDEARDALAVDQGKYLWVPRKACRALLLTPNHEVLLIKIANPDGSWVGWITPGGGIDEGESEQAALARELKEELGFELQNAGSCVWYRSHRYPWNGRVYEQHERFFLVATAKFNVNENVSFTETEKNEIKETRWWKLDEIKHSNETFAPVALAHEIDKLISQGVPKEPIEIGP